MNIWQYVMGEEGYRNFLAECENLVAQGEWKAYIELIDEVNRLIFVPNPHPIEGGFRAAKGALSDTWDGEPAEDTIRRLRDG